MIFVYVCELHEFHNVDGSPFLVLFSNKFWFMQTNFFSSDIFFRKRN